MADRLALAIASRKMNRMVRTNSIEWRDLAVAIVGPLALPALVYGMWLAIDSAVTIGPFDRATLGWATVIPLWLASPWIAALLWRRLPQFADRVAAACTGLILAAASTWLLWSAVVTDTAACEFGPRSSDAAALGLAAFIGFLVGGGWAVGALAASRFNRSGDPWRGLVVAIILAVVQFGVVAVTFGFSVYFLGCNRPH